VFKLVNPTAPPNQRIRDGGVHGLCTIKGHTDALDCTLARPDFAFPLANKEWVGSGRVTLRHVSPMPGGSYWIPGVWL
jgi:hypothetical protein